MKARSYARVINPNALTVFRICLSFVVPVLLLQPELKFRIFAFAVFLVASLTDLMDGYIARLTNSVTRTGKILDPIADKLLILGSMLALSSLGVYSIWFVIPVMLREVLITAIRLRCLLRNEVIAAEMSGKIKTTVQMVSFAVSYAYLLVRDYTHSGALPLLSFLNCLFITAVVAITVYSGARFFKEKQRRDYFHEAAATFLYVGYLPFMPGTFGSLAALPFVFFLPQNVFACLAALAAVTLVAVYSSGRHAELSGCKDPSTAVADEVAGILFTFALIPFNWITAIAGFALFRLFDIFKPLFIRRVETFKSGWGIVLDDVVAGVYANLVLRCLLILIK